MVFAFDPVRWNRDSLVLGGMAWSVIFSARFFGWIALDDLKLILLLALGVITPLAIALVLLAPERRPLSNLASLILFLQPLATLLGGIGLLSNTGLLAAIEVFAWLLFTLLIALSGLLWLLQPDGRQLANANLTLALIYLPIGGTWLVLDRLAIQPLGFSQTIVLLTAVHFHFITLAGLLITGLTGRALQAMQRGVAWQLYRVLASCMLINPLLVAAGITLTQVTGVRLLESIGTSLLASCLILIALFNLRLIVPATPSGLARGLLIISSTSVVFTMLAACAYALGAATGLWTITIAQMIIVHGWINALIFGFCGLLGWRLRLGKGKA